VTRLEGFLTEQRACAVTGDLAATAAADRAFHAELVRTAGNEILSKLYDRLRDRQLRMGVAVLEAHPDRIAANIAEHAELLEAIRSGDADRAAGRIRGHLARVSTLVRGEER
jgi:DNA-binding GntR family transcriptional regulator